MKAVGRFEIQHPVVSGVVETFTARDPSSDATVLLHLLPAGALETPEKTFLEFAPGCPGKILDTGVDTESQRGFVVTEYPKDRKSLLLWIKSLSSVPASKPAPPAAKPVAPSPPPKSNSDGATRMFDPSAMFGGAPPAAEPTPPSPASDGATRMFDPSAIFGAAPSTPAASAADAGATKMFDPSAMFGGASSPPSPPSSPPASSAPPPGRKTPPPGSSHRPITDPFADLKGALDRAAGKTPTASSPSTTQAPSKSAGEFTKRFELPKQFRNAPIRVDRTKGADSSSGVHRPPPEGDKGVFTLMMEAFGQRVDDPEKKESPATPAGPPASSGSDGATRMFDPSALFGGGPPAPETAGEEKKKEEPEKPAASAPGYQATVRMPGLKRDEDDKTSR